ncbi:Zn-dependent hydrolase [Alteromonas sp. ASW11-130]|uniref:Zn-dependent hydrolase n=1 Tax=Alteromonas sp. ASW11-130 TaxID=3015775 RepID=UPI002241B7A8|nr:Zn-dependent hydrolase [Alteromonas sp. ASW11-130]MCW8092357.1 Zn-dependent hydrolase [Alteromonas sp. ASW11-130]
MSLPAVNLDRLRSDLFSLFTIGYDPKTKGVTRLGFTKADSEAKKWLINRFENEGFCASIDHAGNVRGRMDNKIVNQVVATGSHIDTVISGGMFDGALGVLAGLEVMRVVKENNIELKIPLEVFAFAEEEGRFGGMMGVQALIGELTPQWILKAHDVNGVMLEEELKKAGLDPLSVLDARVESDYFKSFIELHIEQGPVLDTIKKPIGVVSSISGVYKWIVRLIGKSNHAGTAPMNMRSDAFMGLANFANEIPRIIDEEGSDKSRLTVGKVDLKPGHAHTVPGEVEFTLVGRDVDTEVMRALADSCRKVLSAIARKHKLMFEFEQMSWLDPQPMSDKVISLIKTEAQNLELPFEIMPSGAGHDAQHMAKVTEAGMIFVPSVAGVSHAPDEWTHWQDIEKGANLLLRSLLQLAR